LNNLAVLCKARGRYTEAVAFYRRALAILEQTFGAAHPKVISCRNNYANLMRRAGRSATAEKNGADGNPVGSSATSLRT
ncbi:MAG TPA: tetratricopeptide repeat protein, partial [Pyrinomonadaceae bacterium]|nr:tetratricopeptide repeat protein [Pyrinomonadaceae bacterium]